LLFANNTHTTSLFIFIESLIGYFRRGSINYTASINTEKINKLTKYGISTMDAVLLYQAVKHPYCEGFVTMDRVLIKKIKDLPFSFGLPVIKMGTFYKQL